MTFAALCLVSACTLGLAESGANSNAVPKPAPKDEPHCQAQRTRVEGSQLDPQLPLCGSKEDDVLISEYGHHVRGFQGNDIICAKNGYDDDIWGGPERHGKDMAYVDSLDVGGGSLKSWAKKHDIEVVTKKPTAWTRAKCKRSSGYSAAPLREERSQAASAFNYPAYNAIVYCDKEPGTPTNRIWFPFEPIIRAVDSAPGTQWQTVAWSPVLYRLEGTEWVFVGQNVWVWDRTFDERAKKAFIGNYWRRYGGRKERWFTWFNPEPGTYKIQIMYHWYKSGRVPAYEFEGVGFDHAGPFQTDQNLDSCTFPAVQPPTSRGRSTGPVGVKGGVVRADALDVWERAALPARKPATRS